jgi:multidrug efflux pump subunit AcrA (membrane-fusion protein)
VTGPPALRGAFNRPESGSPPPAVRATRIGPAARVDAGSQFAGYLYQVHLDLPAQPSSLFRLGGVQWRPPLAVKTFMPAPDGKQWKAVSVPETALLYHQGRALVYVRLEPGKYERREVQVLGRQGDRWVLDAGVKEHEPVVCRNAQLLLSEEFLGGGDND